MEENSEGGTYGKLEDHLDRWSEMEKVQDRVVWRAFVVGLCSSSGVITAKQEVYPNANVVCHRSLSVFQARYTLVILPVLTGREHG